jgi:hypothetical protein
MNRNAIALRLHDDLRIRGSDEANIIAAFPHPRGLVEDADLWARPAL